MVGTKIPGFSLPNSHGETVNIRTFEGQKNVIVVLFRSIHWPYCRWHAGHLGRDYEKFQQLDTALYPILVDNVDNAKELERKYAKKYPIYYDEQEKVAKMLNQESKILKLGRMPGLLIVDKQGIIQYAYYGDSMSDIPENPELLEVINNLNK